ncbi:MAG: BREX system Lon protease-like protein BrxL [Thermoguttaceae bacterium]|nr:BREX system Lon protease-like protein BrxL [Thermoguttaceae bacterium]
MIEKLRSHFDAMVVFKDLKKNNFFSALSLPSFLRDWLTDRFADENGEFDQEELSAFVKENIPRKEDWKGIKDRIMRNEWVTILAKVSINIDIQTNSRTFSLPDYGVTGKETVIEEPVWAACSEELLKSEDTWGIIQLGYRPPNDLVRPRQPGKIRLMEFQNFCPYEVELDYYKEVRNEFSIKEWLNVLLGAVDYNADGYEDDEAKLTMLTRLLPFVEKRLNLVELAPKGTGKSYLYGRVSRFGWLSSGGVMSRAKMFYDISRSRHGLIAENDFIVLDEVQTISFPDVNEMRAALKGYMESGEYTVGNIRGNADAGVVLSGNIRKETMEMEGMTDMFQELPDVFHESALIDRFHGFIKGWKIPRMHDDLKISGWALNSEYFCSILHLLRSDTSYRAIVDQLVHVPPAADTRDTEAVKRLATAWLKLLFPNVRCPQDISARTFNHYCLKRACEMRAIIKRQLGIMDSEYRGKDIPEFSINDFEVSNEAD